MTITRRQFLLLTCCWASVPLASSFLSVSRINRISRFGPSPSPWKLQESNANTADADANVNVNVTIQVPQHCTIDNTGYPSKLHNIHVESILSPNEAEQCLSLATAFGQGDSQSWQQPDAERHTNYATCDFPIEDAPDLDAYLGDIDFQERIFRRLSDAYNVEFEDLLGFIDLFCVNYVAASSDKSNVPGGDQTMDRLAAHRDGSILSFTVLLSSPDDFEGGGTFFDALRDEPPAAASSPECCCLYENGVVRPPSAGYAVLHSGKLLHGADVITKGQRTVLVGFVDVADWSIRPGVERQACTTFGRMDVTERRFMQQQLMMSENGTKQSWSAKRSKQFLPKSSCMNEVIPVFDTARMRSDPEFQRRVKLETEDLMLRSILLEEKPEYLKKLLASGEITVL